MKEILITSSVLIGVILLARLLFRGKVSQKLIYAAWLLVALRLLIPIQFGQSQYSITTLTKKIEAQSKPLQQMQQVMDQPVAGSSRDELYDQLLDEYFQQNPELPKPETPDQITPEAQQQIVEQADQLTAPSLSEVLASIWIVGICAMASWFLAANLIFLHRAKKGSTLFPDCNSRVPVWVSPNVPTPCLVGFFRPVIYLTPASIENEQALRHVLTHELTHLHHADHIWALVRCICLCIYWFDPLVWIAASQSRRDCELACDEGALKKLGDHERVAYGQTLIATVTQSLSPAYLIETATSMNETKKQLKERVSFIVKKPKNILFAAICMILIAALVAGCAFIGASPNVPSNEKNTQPGHKLVYLLTEQTNYTADGNASSTYHYSYDDHGWLVEMSYSNLRNSDFSFTQSYTYDDHGAANANCVFDEDGKLLSYETNRKKYRFEYDQKGRLTLRTKKVYSATDSSCLLYTEYNHCIYDADGRLYKIITPHNGHTPDVKDTEFTYDEQGRLIFSSAEHTSYIYDEDGNLIEQISRGNHMRNFKYTYENGIITGVEHIVKHYPDDQETYQMDGHGNVKCVYWADGRRVEFKYAAIELPDELADRILRYRHVSGMTSTVDAYYDDIVLYFWPFPKPNGTSTDSFGRLMY